ncbi:MAG: nuclear transport factor 2 family protein [Sphingomicrobium sp.]
MATDSSADRAAIIDLIYRYCRLVDRLDHALGYGAWRDDGTADYGTPMFIRAADMASSISSSTGTPRRGASGAR